jgi:hypothetical protein
MSPFFIGAMLTLVAHVSPHPSSSAQRIGSASCLRGFYLSGPGLTAALTRALLLIRLYFLKLSDIFINGAVGFSKMCLLILTGNAMFAISQQRQFLRFVPIL